IFLAVPIIAQSPRPAAPATTAASPIRAEVVVRQALVRQEAMPLVRRRQVHRRCGLDRKRCGECEPLYGDRFLDKTITVSGSIRWIAVRENALVLALGRAVGISHNVLLKWPRGAAAARVRGGGAYRHPSQRSAAGHLSAGARGARDQRN